MFCPLKAGYGPAARRSMLEKTSLFLCSAQLKQVNWLCAAQNSVCCRLAKTCAPHHTMETHQSVLG